MMRRGYVKAFLLGRTIWHGVLGIFWETCLALFFIFVGFLLCVLWWKVMK